MMHISPDLQLAIDAARRGGAVIAEHFTKTVNASEKSQGKGLVTQTDQATEAVILEMLQAHSSYPIISEESAPDDPPAGFGTDDAGKEKSTRGVISIIE